MLLRPGVNLDLHPAMRNVLKYADKGFDTYAGRQAIITSAKDREHGSGSFHYHGLAVDFQTKDLSGQQIQEVVAYLKLKLPSFDVLYEGTHIHIEVGNSLAEKLGANAR